MCPDIDECLSQLVQNDKLAVAVSREHAFNNHAMSTENIHCFKDIEHFSAYAVTIFIPHDHHFPSEINKCIQWAFESGLIKKWSSDSKIRYKHRSKKNARPAVLTVEHFFSAFVLFFMFISFAISAFIAEHIIYRKVRRPNPAHFWLYADMFINGDRHFLLPPSGRTRVFKQRNQTFAECKELIFGSVFIRNNYKR